jgi:hypothetical protein
MFKLLKARRDRKLAIALIAPLVAESRQKLRWLDDAGWGDPYVQGFIATATTLILTRSASKMSSDTIGNMQASTWRAITGHDGDVFGESVCMFSTERNPLFDDGCQNALQFIKHLDHDDPTWFAYRVGGVPPHTRAILRRHWERYFEAFLHQRIGVSNV